tara:strand:+ start:35399 stop:36220 length:822 start_codon:yes stop_codon:yes gene_type:complete
MPNNIIQKMTTTMGNVVQYHINLNDQKILMNELIGNEITFSWSGKVICQCGRIMKSFYRANFCYKCYWESPLASQSIFKPELCTAHLGIEERNLEWEKKFQIAPHYVYLANSSGLKVGITRKSQGITRWIDQGASQAIIIAEVPNRKFSGDIEVSLKRFVNDITNWRKMLSGEPEKIKLIDIKEKLSQFIPDHLKKYKLEDNTVTEIKYPVNEYPSKIKSIKLEKKPIISGELLGIKGQYLILDNNRVMNIRSHEGFIVKFEYSKINKQQELF